MQVESRVAWLDLQAAQVLACVEGQLHTVVVVVALEPAQAHA
eukprot:COSAG02_NODE_1421_length_12690_cov_13.851561_5_plen_42_part_00